MILAISASFVRQFANVPILAMQFSATITPTPVRFPNMAILFDLRMSGVALGKDTSTMQQTETLQKQPKQVKHGVFLWFEPNWTAL